MKRQNVISHVVFEDICAVESLTLLLVACCCRSKLLLVVEEGWPRYTGPVPLHMVLREPLNALGALLPRTTASNKQDKRLVASSRHSALPVKLSLLLPIQTTNQPNLRHWYPWRFPRTSHPVCDDGNSHTFPTNDDCPVCHCDICAVRPLRQTVTRLASATSAGRRAKGRPELVSPA